jgi:pantoate--beta-alanine ligase
MKAIQRRASLLKCLPTLARPLAIVPTMGALHGGHVSLIKKARKLVGPDGTVAVSIFLNPKQFGPKEDLTTYPRPLKADLALCELHGVDVVYHPAASEVYSAEHSTWVDEEAISVGFCGGSRPGHFRGVCTIVLKLLNLFSPEIALFGEKDYQQLAVIRRMVRDLDIPTKIVGVSTVREKDGLALSSRNVYLTKEQRVIAPHFRAALIEVGRAIKERSLTTSDAGRLFQSLLMAGGPFDLDYFEVVNPDSLAIAAPRSRIEYPVTLLAAVYLGRTRLIDNLVVR